MITSIKEQSAGPASAAASAEAIARSVGQAVASGAQEQWPYRHWLLREILGRPVGEAVANLPISPATIGDTGGKRETHNSTRVFFSVDNRTRFSVCDAIARAFQAPATVARIGRRCDAALDGSFLRIEYCQDTDGFWLEPHTDIGAKLFTLLVYLSQGETAESWGTDIYDEQKQHCGSVPCRFDTGLMFVPAADTWHGFAPRRISGVRKTLIVNYVRPEWRSRHELAFPDAPVFAAD